MVKEQDKIAASIGISEKDDRDVLFTPVDEDRFVLSCRDTVRYAQWGLGWNAFRDEVKSLIEFVKHWAKDQQDKMTECCVTIRDGQFVVFVVPKLGRFDLALSDRLVALDAEIVSNFPQFNCDVLQAPVADCSHLSSMATPPGIANV